MDNIHRIWATTPAVIMAAGTLPMLSSNAPEHVRYGGACLAAIAAIVADLKNNKKFGYTDKIISAVRTIPGMKDADEGTVLGALCISASGFLGGGAALTIAQTGQPWPEALKLGYNALSYPLAATIDFQSTKRLLERYIPKEVTFKIINPDGSETRTDPVAMFPLLQQAALLTGALGITTYGTLIDVGAVQATGFLFAISNGLSLAQLSGKQISHSIISRMRAMQTSSNEPLTAEQRAAIAEQIRTGAAEFVETFPPPPIMLDAPVTQDAIAQAAESAIQNIIKDAAITGTPNKTPPSR